MSDGDYLHPGKCGLLVISPYIIEQVKVSRASQHFYELMHEQLHEVSRRGHSSKGRPVLNSTYPNDQQKHCQTQGQTGQGI